MSANMSFWEHVGELRKHLVRSLAAVAIAAFLVGFNIEWVMDNIIFAPVNKDFITFRFFNSLAEWSGSDYRIIMPDEFPIQVRRVFEQINMMLMISLVGGFIVAFPFIVLEIWKFIRPALTEKEQKNASAFIFSVSIMFLVGVFFGYFLVVPLSMQFGYFFSLSPIIKMNIDLSSYVSVVLQSCLGMGLVFLFPVIVYALTQIGILQPNFLTKYRRQAIVVVLMVAAVITPADAVSMIVAAIPLLFLYEFSILTSKWVFKRKSKQVNTI